ncbi:hypothetical protein GCM10009771_05910 [Nesterenkonia flava]
MLILVRTAFGTLPADSVVAIGIVDGTTSGHLRADLPCLSEVQEGPADSVTATAHAERVAEWFAGSGADPRPEAIMLAVFSQDAAAAAYAALLIGAFEEYHGVPVVSAWWAEATAVRRILLEPFQVDEREDAWNGDWTLRVGPSWAIEKALRESPFAAQDSTEACCGGAGLVDEALEELVTAEHLGPSEAELEASRYDLPPLPHFSEQGMDREVLAQLHRAAALWEAALAESARAHSARWMLQPDRLARLLQSLRWLRLRDAIVPLAALGFETVQLGYLHLNRHTEEHLRAFAQCNEASMGLTEHAPNWQRIEALHRILGAMAPYAQGEEQAAVTTMLAWIAWAKGQGSRAARMIEECCQAHPRYELAQLMRQYFSIGPSRWARVKRHSYSWWAARFRGQAEKHAPPPLP